MVTQQLLLVEDDADDVELALMALRHFDRCEIVVARDGAEALELLFAEGARRPKLVLLDLKMPKVDGLEVLKRIKGDPQARTIPVVMLSSSSEERDIEASYQLGANSYVRKRIDYGAHSDAMRQLGAYWLSLNE